MPIRWLHLSDVHEHHGERYVRGRMYDQIVAHVTAMVGKGRGPDLVFLTGDLAFKGQAAEYEMLEAALIAPLREAVGPDCKLFMVPGNHDLDRDSMAPPRTLLGDKFLAAAFQSPDPVGQKKRKELLFPRFQAYAAFEKRNAAWGVDWLDSADGTVSWNGQVQGHPVAVVGLNTAWYCQDNDDWGKLTPGRLITEKALDAARAKAPAALFVLGHHPLEAFFGDGAVNDGKRVRDRLIETSSFYLHGHLHANSVEQVGAHDGGVVTFQAPAAFQAHDNPAWPNGLQWGEVDPATNSLIVEPYLWNESPPEYQFDIRSGRTDQRTDDRDGFWVRQPKMPAPTATLTPTPTPSTAAPNTVAPGWEILTPDDLAARTEHPPTAREMGDWFDGQFPRWEVALAKGIRPRRIVEDIVRRFEAAHHGAPQPIVTLLTGAGGEGKSAALMQVAAGLLRGRQNWTCLWRGAAAADLPEDLFTRLDHRPDHAWIVAVDDAENIGAAIPAALRRLPSRTDVHVVLATRDADWQIQGPKDTLWSGVAAFKRTAIGGLDAEDALRIAEGWTAYGDEAMGNLQGQTAEQAAGKLFESARREAARSEDGALLGALLSTRTGEDLKSRVVRLMEPWVATPGINGKSLLDIYAMIAAMHAENQLYLSHQVLADTLGCTPTDLDIGPLLVLRREAMVDGGSTYILTRHRRIAETARDWLLETGYNLEAAYVSMARAAILGSGEVLGLSKWRSELTRHFVDGDHREKAIAVAIAKALFIASPHDWNRLSVYASTLRRTGRPKEALALLRQEVGPFARQRGVIYEWSVAAGAAGDPGLNVWLAARSLADDRTVPLDAKRINLSLAGLGSAFRELYHATRDAQFAAAQAVCGRLGLMQPDLDATSRGYFASHRNAVVLGAGVVPKVEAELARLKLAVVEAAYLSHPENDDPPLLEKLIYDPEGYHFTMLKTVVLQWQREQEAARKR